MSASDAAPLPRLGEVFFDVRGSSRSMRLSWYADTGVAVLSIWQGGMCTGTFRLAIDDLPRMVETLQRGPDGQRADRRSPVSGRQAVADAPRGASVGGDREPLPGGGLPDYQLAHPAVPGYQGGPTGRHSGGRHSEPADYGPGTGQYLPAPAEYPAHAAPYLTGPDDYQPEPPGGRTEYLADLPGPGHDTGAAYPRDAVGPGRYQEDVADDPYLGDAGTMDYQDAAHPAYYPPGTSAPGHGDAEGRSDTDYAAHYGTAVTDDNAPGSVPESFPYRRPPGNRGA